MGGRHPRFVTRPLTPMEQRGVPGTERPPRRSTGIEHLLLPGAALVSTLPPTVFLTDGIEVKPVETLATRLTSRGEAMLIRLLRPVVPRWMNLRLQHAVEAVEDLPVDLSPNDAGMFWLVGDTVYLWEGGCYRWTVLPQPDPHHVITVEGPLDADQRDTVIRAWGGDKVMVAQPPPRRAEPIRPAAHYPVTAVAAISPCPRCSDIQTHWLRLPAGDADPVDAEVIRQCRECGQEWGEQ